MKAENRNSDADGDATLYVTVKSEAQFLRDGREAAEALVANDAESVARPHELSFPSVAALFREFTPKKVELLGALVEHQPESITETADVVDRDVKNVHQNLVEFAELGVVKFVEDGRAKRPVARYDGLQIDVPFVDRPAEGASPARAD
jgi:predicted transcriptional regulator